MRAVRVHAFGGVDALVLEQIPVPQPGSGQILVRVAAAGVGPWDAWIRSGRSVLPQPLPLTPGSDIAGVVVAVGEDIERNRVGMDVFGVTNARFCGGYAEYALAEAAMTAPVPAGLGSLEAASLPVIAVTAHQLLFRHGQVEPGQSVLVLGGAGNVGAFAVQLAHLAGARVTATGRATQHDEILALGAERALMPDEAPAAAFDVVVDTVGGAALDRAIAHVRRGGRLVSAVAEPDRARVEAAGIQAGFMLVDVDSETLAWLGDLVAKDQLRTRLGLVLPLEDAREAHAAMASGVRTAGKILLRPSPDLEP